MRILGDRTWTYGLHLTAFSNLFCCKQKWRSDGAQCVAEIIGRQSRNNAVFARCVGLNDLGSDRVVDGVCGTMADIIVSCRTRCTGTLVMSGDILVVVAGVTPVNVHPGKRSERSKRRKDTTLSVGRMRAAYHRRSHPVVRIACSTSSRARDSHGAASNLPDGR